MFKTTNLIRIMGFHFELYPTSPYLYTLRKDVNDDIKSFSQNVGKKTFIIFLMNDNLVFHLFFLGRWEGWGAS